MAHKPKSHRKLHRKTRKGGKTGETVEKPKSIKTRKTVKSVKMNCANENIPCNLLDTQYK